MPFKPIDLQMSIPRTPEHSSLQGQINHRHAVEQTKLGEQEAKQMELQRGRNAEIEQSNGLHVRSEQDKQDGSSHSKKRKQEEQAAKDDDGQPAHPYKGHHFDVSL